MSSSPTSSYASGYDPKYGYNRNAFVHSPPHLRLIGGVLRHVIMPPIALAAEGLASRKDSSRRRSSAEAEAETEVPVEEADAQSGLTEYSFQGTEEDAQDWDLDEAVAGEDDGIDGAPTTASEGDNSLPSYLAAISTPAPTATTPRLPFPIIIPQRRPGTKSRGFIRAYAPVLENSNLASTDFTSFLQAFHAATQASPILNVIAFSCSIASTATTAEPITSSALFAAYIVAEAAKEVQERWRTNKFLEEANARIFKPRGLFCCVVTYKQSPANIEGGFEVERETVDIGANAIAKYGGDVKLDGEETSKVEELRAKAQRLRVASGETREAEMPVVCAPLVFPALEEALRTDDVRGLRVLNTKAKATGFVVDYFDRRSQAIFQSNNPNSILTALAPQPQFKSNIADPRDARNTHFITLLTGGKIKAEPLGGKRRFEKAQREAAERRAKGLKTQETKRGMKEDVLYLMIVNLPTEVEVEKARRAMEEKKSRKRAT